MLKPVFLLVFVLVVALSCIFYVEGTVDTIREDITAMQQQINAEKAQIKILQAEWSYLNRPERIADMAQKYLQLDVISPDKIAQVQYLNNHPMMLSDAADRTQVQAKRLSLIKDNTVQAIAASSLDALLVP